MENARQKIIRHLELKRASTVSEISKAIRTTPANIRHHLALLLEAGVVTPAGRSPQRRRGRPAAIYALAEKIREHNLGGLASALLSELCRHSPNDALPQLAQHMAGECYQEKESMTRRLVNAVQRFNEMHYQAHWEAHADAPRLILGHCPYAAIINDHPELCQLDALMLEELTGASLAQEVKRGSDLNGLPFCRFIITSLNT